MTTYYYGTAYFVSLAAAISYYRAYGYPVARETVQGMVESGEIHIGKPPHKSTDRLILLDDGARYAVVVES